MPYDKYRNWPLPISRGARAPSSLGLTPEVDIKKQVLQDLGLSPDEIDLLEILDSFEAWVQRAYQVEIARALAGSIILQAQPFIEDGILGRFPHVMPTSRPRRAQKPL